ncbi:MAG: TolC family protein [Xanthomonadales bacterium]|nr:TolC family protein [Xanthomonadales bacterium]
MNLPALRLVFCLLLVTAASTAWAQTEPPLGATLDPLIAYARRHHPALADAQAQVDAAQQRAAYAGALPNPRLRLEWMDITRGGEHGPNLLPTQVGSMRYSFMQELPWPGKRELQRGVAAAQAESAQAQARDVATGLVAQITDVFAQRYALAQMQQQTRDIQHLLVQLEAAAAARYSSGLGAQQDVIRAQLEQTRVRSQLLELEGRERRLAAQLNALLDRPGDAVLAPAEALPALPPEERLSAASLRERVLRNNPSLAGNAALLRAAQESRDLVRRDRYPDFSLGLAPVQMGDSIREWELMLEIAIPLQQGARRAKEREAEAELDAARWRQQASERQVLSELDARLASLRTARATAELIERDLLPQAELTYQSALSGYASGQVDFATVLEAQRQIHQAWLDRAQRQIEAYSAVSAIERLLGEAL